MEIIANNISKRYRRQWVFRDLNHHFAAGSCWAICGPNGSGKSTLLKILSGYTSPTKGKIEYQQSGSAVAEEQVVTQFSFVAPYQQLIEEYTLLEQLQFHFKFKEALLPNSEIVERAGLEGAEHKFIHEFSSGMKQRLKLALALFSGCECLFLDEPTSNLDEKGIEWYQQEMLSIKGNKNIIIASNQRYEYAFTDQIIQISDFISGSLNSSKH